MNLSTIIQAIYYLLRKLGPTDKLKIVKLVYLADKIHLIEFGRTITEDTYYALRRGPVGSLVADIVGFNENVLEVDEIELIKSYFMPGRGWNLIEPNEGQPMASLSKSDSIALDFVLKTFGHMHQNQLVDLVHRFPEWARFKEFFISNPKGRKPLTEIDLISRSPNPADLPGIDDARVTEAISIKSGLCF